MSVESERQRYENAMHAIMTGVGYVQTFDPNERDVKHLRTGINSALISNGALTRLLIDRGIFTEEEWYKTLADVAEHDVKTYQEMLKRHYGGETEVTLY